jgi:hypothetical protein
MTPADNALLPVGTPGSQLKAMLVQAAPFLYYCIFFGLVSTLWWKVLLKRLEFFKNIFKAHGKYVWWLHGTLTFTLMYCSQPSTLLWLVGRVYELFPLDNDPLGTMTLLKYSFTSLLAVILWDFGYYTDMGGSMFLAITAHHSGLFLAMFLGPGWDLHQLHSSDPPSARVQRQVFLDTCMFGWLWAIHSFGFLLEIVLPFIFRVRLQEGQRSKPVDIIKHMYAMVSVLLYHRYLNFNQEMFWTYQTCSLMFMLCGRFGANGNWRNVDFLRRIEVPGFSIVLIDRAFGLHDPFCERAVAIFVLLMMTILAYVVFFRELMPKPEIYVAPDADRHPELLKFLEEETDKVLGTELSPENRKKAADKWQGMQGHVKGWWGSQGREGKKWKDVYPVHNAIVNWDIADAKGMETCRDEFVGLLEKHGAKALDWVHTDWYDSCPLHFCVPLQYPYESTLILLKRGANPYLPDANKKCAVELGLGDPFRIACWPAALGYSEGFWQRFNEICLAKSPAKVLTRYEKFREILSKL